MCATHRGNPARGTGHLNEIPVLLGPTATGKTHLLSDLASRYDMEVLSCDSRQVYQGMPVGTAQPDQETLKRIPHHLVGFLSPGMAYSAGQFRKACNEIITEVLKRGRIPVISGGTGFYFRALTTEMIELADDAALRENVHAMRHEERLALLQAKDPLSLCEEGSVPASGRVHRNDVYRVERALYILLLTGRPLRSFYESGFKKRTDLSFTGIWLDLPPEEWKKQVSGRAVQMIKDGLVDEAVAIKRQFGDCPALRTPGYAEALQFASGNLSRKELEERLIRSHLQYGRRQRVWFRRETSLVPVTGRKEALKKLEKLLLAGIQT